MQSVVIQSLLYQTTLYISEQGLEADVKSPTNLIHFTQEQISCGILGDLSPQNLIARIHLIGTTNIAAFAYPQKKPTELWIFEAVPMAASAIKRGKKKLRRESYKEALEQFKIALKTQQGQGGEIDELEKAIDHIQKRKNCLKWKQIASLYLPNLEEVERFESILATYEDQDDIYACFQTLVAIEDYLSPHHYLMTAIVYARQKQWQEAITAYLHLADDNPHALACIAQAYALFEKANLLDEQDAVQMAFEKTLNHLSMVSSSPSPTCFICYNTKEKDVREWLEKTFVAHLDLAGIKPLICLQEMRLGQDLSSFHELARQADFVIIACTPGLKAKCEKKEKAPIGLVQEIRLIKERLYRDKDKAGTLFPIILKGTKEESIPTTYLDIFSSKISMKNFDFYYFVHAFELLAMMRNLPRQKASNLFESFIQDVKPILGGELDREELMRWQVAKKQRVQALQEGIAHRLAQLTKRINLPLSSSYFTGREVELEKLHAACRQKHRVAVTGLGGVGKTALALQYANVYQAHYSLIHFMPAGTPQLVIEGLLKLADDLFVPRSDKVEERLTRLKTVLDRKEQEYLLIFDGVDNVEAFAEMEKYLPNRGCCLLLTSRLPEESKKLGFKDVKFTPLSVQEATLYLLKVTGSQEEKHAQALAMKLGCLPLALTHAAGYIRRRGISIEAYCRHFDCYQLELFEPKCLTLNPNERTILTTWQMSMDAIVRMHKCSLAQDVLAFFAFLAQAPIPLHFVQKWFKSFSPKQPELELANALAHLCNYSMITSPKPDTYSIHPLVQQVTRHLLSVENYNRYLKHTLQVSLEIVQKLDFTEANHRRQLFPLILHFKVIASYAHSEESFPNLIEILRKIWEYDYHSGNYQELEQIARKCLAICQTPQQRADSLNCLSLSFQKLGKLAEALDYQRETLKIKERLLGGHNPNLAIHFNNIGAIAQELGRYQEALEYNQQALQLTQLQEDEHLQRALSLDKMGSSLEVLGRDQESLKYHMQALELMKRLLGDKHPDVATCLNNIGLTLGKLDKQEEALKYHKLALEIRRDLLDEKHSDIAQSLNNIGSVLQALGRPKEALAYHRQALELCREVLGDKHPAVATILSNLGSVLGDLDKHEDALSYHMQALKIWTDTFEEKHPNAAKELGKVGASLQKMARYQEALCYEEKALKLHKELLGDKHPEVATDLDNIGVILQKLGKLDAALDYHRQALQMRRKLLGDKHSEVATSLSNMASDLQELGRYQEALEYHMQTLQMRKELLGEKHPEVAISLNNIGSVLWKLSHHKEALLYYMQALELTKELFGDKHLQVANILNNVGTVMLELGQPKQALSCHEQALQMRKELLGANHLNAGMSFNNIGSVYSALNNHEKALDYYKQSLEILRDNLGEKHPIVAAILSNLGSALGELNQHEEALRYHQQALAIKKECLGETHPDVLASRNNVDLTLQKISQQKTKIESTHL